MSRREYPVAERYEERETDFYRRPRHEREYDELEVDISRSRNPDSRRGGGGGETIVRERDTVVDERRGPRRPDFLREDHGRASNAGQLVVRDERREEDVYSRRGSRRREVETDDVTIRERSRARGGGGGLPYPRSQASELDFREDEEVVFRERTRSRPPRPREERSEEEVIFRERTRSRPPPPREERSEEKIDISVRREESRPPPPRERDVEEIRFRRGGGDRPGPSRSVVDREEIDIREERSAAPPRREVEKEEIDIDIRERRRGRGEVKEEIDIREERSVPPPRQRSVSRGALVARKEEEWVVRRPRTPPQRDYEKEQIIIRRKERSLSPEPPREPTPEPPSPPPEPIYRPPIIQEYITHHRHIDHGVERARSPTPPPPPSPPSPAKEENLEIEIRRTGTRNGKPYDEDIIFERDVSQRRDREVSRDVSRHREVSIGARRRSPSRHFEEDVSAEADFYNRKVSARGRPGEAWNGATKEWELVDVPPGTERVRMDGVGGGRQEITWQRYNGERRGKFYSGDRVYEEGFGESLGPGPVSRAPSAPPPPRGSREIKEEIKITDTRTTGDRPRKRDKMWTEVTKDLVIKEAVEECGYEYEETDEHFYVMEYLKYEDVLHLVEVTEDIRRERRERIREIQWQREESERAPKMLPPPAPAPPRSRYDERIYEREYIYDRDGRRWRRN